MSNNEKLVVVDYGMGNLWSGQNALRYVGANPVITSDPSVIENADSLIIPGVGSFRLALQAMHEKGVFHSIAEAVLIKQRKVLGICLGFQMLAQASSEDGLTHGLGVIPGPVDRFTSNELHGNKLPHIGFNRVVMPSNEGLFAGFGDEADFYFVHSYRILLSDMIGQCAICHYGTDFVAAYQRDNIFGTQFHPEKSQTNGLLILRNFLAF